MLKIKIFKEFKKTSFTFTLDIDLELAPWGAIVFFGASGSGKTLTMQCVAGVKNPDRGLISLNNTIFYDSAEKTRMPPQKRHVGYMPQDYALFPHLTVLQNVAYSHTTLFGRRLGKQVAAAAKAMLARLNISKLESHFPGELSGGQKQRVALARAINAKPGLLLLDEPFSALDPLLRSQMRRQIHDILQNFNIPAIIITHDPLDVDVFAGQIVIFRDGKAIRIDDWADRRTAFSSPDECLLNIGE